MGTPIGSGSVYENPRTGEDLVVYQVGTKKWVAESNTFDLAEETKKAIMKKVKFRGFTKFIGYESFCDEPF